MHETHKFLRFVEGEAPPLPARGVYFALQPFVAYKSNLFAILFTFTLTLARIGLFVFLI